VAAIATTRRHSQEVNPFTAFLAIADRTNGLAFATVLRPSVVVCDVIYCGQTVRPRAKLVIESL